MPSRIINFTCLFANDIEAFITLDNNERRWKKKKK